MRRKLSIITSMVVAWALPFAIRAEADPKKTIQGRLLNTGTAAGYGSEQNSMGIYGIISQVISIALEVLGVVFLVLIVYGGYVYMIARGDEGMVEKAKNTITRAVIGLVIVLLSYSIANFVVPKIYCASNPAAKGCSVPTDPEGVLPPSF